MSAMVAASETQPLPPASAMPTSSMGPVTQFPPPLTPSPRATTTASTEVAAKRTANSDTFDNHNGTMTTKVSQGMNYHTPSGYQPVDLTFHAPGAGMSGVSAIEDHSDVTVSVSSSGLAAIGPEGTGMRILTPGLAGVAGSVASSVLGGVSWKFTPTGAGLEAATMVPSRQGARTYAFNVQLLGGAKALSVDASGDLVSGAFSVSRPLVVGADGGIYPTGAWAVSGSTISFGLDDTSLPGSAIPYVIDPNWKWSFAGTGGASFVNTSSSYGSGGSTSVTDASSYFAIADNRQPNGQYVIADAALTFDTSSIPTNGFPEYAKINLFSCSAVQADANESLVL
ncbi:MAG TPA: hypothetical protein VFW71_04150, partial [Actinomycetota bacterium]|nr:hypothetical protein [Actinomycetota bacterium]